MADSGSPVTRSGSEGTIRWRRKEARARRAPRRPAARATVFTEHGYKVAQLAAILATRFVIQPGQSNIDAARDGDWTLVRDEASHELDRFYLSLVRRAEFLLVNAEGHSGSIHASQLFDSTRRYTIREVTDEFQNAGWTGLTSENAVRSLMTKIGKETDLRAQTRLEHLLRLSLDPQYLPHQREKSLARGRRPKIERDIADLLKDPALIAARSDVEDHIKEQVRLSCSRQHMIDDCLGRGKADSGVNAYAVFSICADENVFDDKLWRRRGDLSRLYPL